jgi:hypothetical protein
MAYFMASFTLHLHLQLKGIWRSVCWTGKDKLQTIEQHIMAHNRLGLALGNCIGRENPFAAGELACHKTRYTRYDSDKFCS